VVTAFIAYLSAQILVWMVAGVLAAASARTTVSADLIPALARIVPIALPASLVAAGLALVLVLRRWRRRLGGGTLARVLGLSWGGRSQVRKAALSGAGLALLMLPLMGLVVHRPEPPDLITQLTSSSGSALWAWIISAVLLAPPIEELMFRGALLGGLGETWSFRGGAVVSATTFWLMHGPEFVHWPAALAIGTMTILATRLRVKSGALGPAIALHFGYNLVLGTFLAVALLTRPQEARWARTDVPPTSGSGSTQSEDGELSRTTKACRYCCGAHPTRHVEGREGIAVPTLEETSCPHRLHRG
jgi:membrane protease YdiL (CAAX protease family)